MTNLLHWAYSVVTSLTHFVTWVFDWIVLPSLVWAAVWAIPIRIGMIQQLRKMQRTKLNACPMCELRGKFASWTFKINRFVMPASKVPIIGFAARFLIGGLASIWYTRTIKEGAEYAARQQTALSRMRHGNRVS